MGLLARFKESGAIRNVAAALGASGGVEQGVAAAQRLGELGGERAIPILREALFSGRVPLQVQAAKALAAVHQRRPDQQILKALNGAALAERQDPRVRQAAIEALCSAVDLRHAGSLVEVLKSPDSPLPVRQTAFRCLKRLRYPELLERLVENLLLGERLDPRGAVRKWAIGELGALDDHDKLTKLFEIAHGRRRLRHRALSPEAGDPATLVLLMARLDPRGSVRFLHQMVDDDNPGIRSAAAQALRDIKARKDTPG
ncbi:MAG: HEAT repeat domain-containing protein [Candidatus Brocadiia bacterium]